MLVSQTNEWKKLTAHKNEMEAVTVRELFENNPKRFEEFSTIFNEILFDYSKNIITKETVELLLKLAEATNLKAKIEAMFNGEKINSTEKRAVLHTALRNQNKDVEIVVDGENIVPQIDTVLMQIENFVDKIHSGKHLGATGKKITDVVNIGIGGSDLGPAMVVEALQFYAFEGINSHFVSNVDGTDIITTCKKLNPETTLFIVASKTFTTQETITNANAAKKWLTQKLGNSKEIIGKHFVALSTNISACEEFGINKENVFQFWDWVGGRYSLWSAIGLSIAISVGMPNFRELLRGAFEMDCHFRNTDFAKNIPVLMALLGIWYNNFFGANTYCVVPYDQYLLKFPAFLQQLDMESNGKRITKEGEIVDYSTGAVIWGEIGTNAQHSFFLFFHQGTQLIPADFIAFVKNVNDDNEQHKILLSNFFAQTEALMKGKNADEVFSELQKEGISDEEIKKLLPHKIFTGNKPTNTIFIEKLTPKTLGMLIAMYEHKVFVQGAIWDVNQFDQWGVELGKQLAKKILPELNSKDTISTHDASTNGLINYFASLL
jgi:glucose-6-phosphate isomerase